MARKPRGKRFSDDEMDEDDTLEEGNPHQRRRRRKSSFLRIPRWVYRVTAILLLCVLGMLVWLNRENLAPENVAEWVKTQVVGMGVGDGFPAKLAGSEVSAGNFLVRDKNLVYVSDTALTVLNSTAKELVSRQHSYSDPVLRCAGGRMLIYNLGGRGYQIESQSRTLRKGVMDQYNLQAGDIAANGRYALVTEEKGYCSLLTVYLPDGTKQYQFNFADCYVTDISLNRDGTKAAVTGISGENGGMVSYLYLLDFSDSKEKGKIKYQDVMLMSVNYGENGTVAAVGDSLASTVHQDGTKTDYSYNGQQLLAFSVQNGRTALALAPYANSAASYLKVVDETGKEKTSKEISGQVSSVSLLGDTAAVLCGGTVTGYSVSGGTSLGSCSAGGDARAVALKDEGSVYLLGVSEIRSQKLS